jgi:long-chain fatty acid transport protein
MPAVAGGLYITEFGQPSMGTSGAGATILAEDASTGIANPAGIFLLDSDSEWMVNAMVVAPSAKFRSEADTTIPGNDGGDAGQTALGGSVFHARKLSDKWGLGAGINSISAAALDYDDGFVGRHWVEEIELLTITATVNLAYQINEAFSVAVGVPMMFGRLDMDVAIPPLVGPVTPDRDGLARISDGNDFSVTIALAAMWQANERLRMGLTYLGENELTFDGDLEITLPGLGGGTTIGDIGVDVEIPFAQTLILSAAQDLGDRLTMLASVHWEDWSTIDNLPISTNAGGAALPRDWDDTWKFALGLRWRTGGAWTYYTGVAYDTDPTSADKRTADMPIDRQIRLSAGATYKFSERTTIGGALTYADYGDARIDNSNGGGTVVGEYSTNSIIFLGFNVNWK